MYSELRNSNAYSTCMSYFEFKELPSVFVLIARELNVMKTFTFQFNLFSFICQENNLKMYK